MGPEDLRSELRALVAGALGSRFGVERPVLLSEPRSEAFGDLTTQAALEAAPEIGLPPREVAAGLLSAMSLPAAVESAGVEGPGFINFRLSDDHLAETASALSGSGLVPLLGGSGSGRRALVEFVSSNPTGPLSVGHCRQAVLGEAISGLLEAAGWKVEREYYFNDSGRQMDLLAESLAARYLGLRGEAMDIPEGGYKGEYLERWAADLMAGEPGLQWPSDADAFRVYSTRRAMDMIREDLDLLGIRFDRYFSEASLIPDAVEEAISRLSMVVTGGGPLVYEDPPGSGKRWARLTALGRPEDRVLVRDGGGYTYRTPDIAYHLDKFDRGYDLMVDVFGSDHLDTSRDVTALLSAILGEAEVASRLRVILHQFVTLVRDGRKVRMSTRAANFVTMRELVEEAGSADVTRYLFLTRKAEAHMDFDLEVARRQSDDNPVYYVQYACARISGILRTARAEGLETPADAAMAGFRPGADERRLMRLLEAVPSRVVAAAEALEPHRLTEMLHELATAFHGFYQRVRVVDTQDPGTSAGRLILCSACRNTMRDLLGVLGVAAPERM